MTSHRRKSPVTGAMLALALFALVASGLASLAPVSAQDASPAAVACVSPGLPEGGAPTPMDEASPEAMEEMDMGSPEAMPPAVAPEMPEGTAADDATADAIDAALANYAACYNESAMAGEFGSVAVLHSANYLMNTVGTDNPYDWAASEAADPFLTSVELLDSTNQMTYEDGRVSADIQVLLNGVWQQGLRSFLVQEGDAWLYDEEVQITAEPDADATTVTGANITEITDEASGAKTYEFTWLGTNSVTATEAINLTIGSIATNTELHEAVLVLLPAGADPMGLLDESVAFEDVQFIGGIFDIYPGQTLNMVLWNLPAGEYTLLCFFPGPDGAPHAANGMISTFTVTEPAA